MHVAGCLCIHVGWVTSNRTLHGFDELLQVPYFDFGVAVHEALNSLDAVFICFHYFVGVCGGWVSDVHVTKLNYEPLVSC